MADDNPIPKEWRDLGYSGLFTVMMPLHNAGTDEPADPDRVAILAAKVPYEITTGWLALAVEHLDGPQLVLVRRDDAAVSETIVKGGFPK